MLFMIFPSAVWMAMLAIAGLLYINASGSDSIDEQERIVARNVFYGLSK
jgi:fucose permease